MKASCVWESSVLDEKLYSGHLDELCLRAWSTSVLLIFIFILFATYAALFSNGNSNLFVDQIVTNDSTSHQMALKLNRSPQRTAVQPCDPSARRKNKSVVLSNPTRTRSQRPENWQCNVQKTAKQAGQAYTSKKGKHVAAVVMKNPCACQKNCCLTVSEEERQEILNAFYALTQEEKWNFIIRHCSCEGVKKRTTDKEGSKRNSSRQYVFLIGSGSACKKVPICKTMFVNTLSIGHSMIDGAYKHLLKVKPNYYLLT